MQIVSYQDERPCSESEAALLLCRYYLGVQVAVMAAEAAVGNAKGELWWREREWQPVKGRRREFKRVAAGERQEEADSGSRRYGSHRDEAGSQREQGSQ